MARKRLAEELMKKQGFRSPRQQAIVALLRTHDKVQIQFTRLFREFGLTIPQYNVLRILRGEARPLRCCDISRRTIAEVPGMTRVIDRLLSEGWVSRSQCQQDRRVWWVEITASGRQLLKKMDRPLDQLEDAVCGGLGETEIEQLNDLLDKLRHSAATLDGSSESGQP